jgi:hypothetical protein
MNKNLKKHALLKILSEQYIEGWDTEILSGIVESQIKEDLNISHKQLRTIIAELLGENEVQNFKPNENSEQGWMTNDNGAASYGNEKYKKIRTNNNWNLIKNWVQTVIPVLSLIVTIMVILRNDTITDRELQELRGQIEYIKQQESKIVFPTKSLAIDCDSISVTPLE